MTNEYTEPEPESFEEEIKYAIWSDLVDYIDSTDYFQDELAQMLNTHVSEVSRLLRGQWPKFSIERLIRFAGKLNFQIVIKMDPPTQLLKPK